MTVNCKTPGLRIEWHNVRANLYATLMHEGANVLIRSFQKPVEGGKRRFAAKVDAALSGIDWTRAPEALVADETAKHAVLSIRA